MVAAVRDARHEEARAIADLLSRAGFGPTVARLIAFPRTSPHGDVLVAETATARPVGAVVLRSLRRDGLDRRARRRPRGAPARRRRGAHRGGVRAPARARRGRPSCSSRPTWAARSTSGSASWPRARRPRGAGRPARSRRRARCARLREDDRAAVRALDRAATGEDRAPVLDALHPLARRGRRARGRARRLGGHSPWGAGIAICAADERPASR